MLETKEEDVILITRNGVEVAQITLIPPKSIYNRIGIAKGKIITSDDFDEVFNSLDNEIEDFFEGEMEI